MKTGRMLAFLLLSFCLSAPCVAQAGAPGVAQGLGHGEAAMVAFPHGAEWIDAVRRDLREGEYDLSWQHSDLPELRDAWQAPNRAQGFRTWFTPDGIIVVPRLEAPGGAAWQWGLRPIRLGSTSASRKGLSCTFGG